ncbi:sigma-70 family RNA polymerase sigma factor [Reichenbachiella sp. MALMAid0571]|uniref:RNA polymerase sigma factor n=1 Tax=Reichenbachiella sp. MALMAid0571 TaxID=3143939 RepID=UPI0032E03E98
MSKRENIDEEILKEEQLIEASKKDLGQFEYLYNKYYESIFRYVYHRTGDEDETADIVSKVFINAMNALDKYECRGLPFGAWLFRIASNETKKYFRGSKTMVLCIDEQKLAELWNCGQVEDESDKVRIIEKLIEHLNEEEIVILQLKYFEDKNFKEIALLLNKKESAVKMKMYRALNKLKSMYDKIDPLDK